jgi:hypothetical protein
MKNLLLKTIAICAILLPVNQAGAKNYGGFKPGETFTLKLDYRTSVKAVGTLVTDKQPIPAGIPNFKVGSKVEFTIGKNGQLTAKGLSMPFKEVDKVIRIGDVLYLAAPKNGYPFGDTGRLGKSAAGKPRTLALDFAKTEIKAGVTTSYRVYYSFVK